MDQRNSLLLCALWLALGASGCYSPYYTDRGAVTGGLLGGGNKTSGGDGLGSLLDLNGDGNPLDDIIGMAGKLVR